MIRRSEILECGWNFMDGEGTKVFSKNGFVMELMDNSILITKGFRSYHGVPLNVVFLGYIHNTEDLVMLEKMIGSKNK